MNGWPTNRAFGDADLTPDNFSEFSKQEVDADSKAKGLEQLEPIPPVRSTTPMELSSVIGDDNVKKITDAGKITFHTMGDTGGIHSPQFQFAVADAMAADVDKNGASFFYHLGDVVYYFGQEEYYFGQFYDPYRDYDGPIFAIPGNHDGVVYKGENAKSLDAFVANFCASQPATTPDSQGAVRTTMNQPGVYFTLNAPGCRKGRAGPGQRARVDHRDPSSPIYRQLLSCAEPRHAKADRPGLRGSRHSARLASLRPLPHVRAIHSHCWKEADSLSGGWNGWLLWSAGLEAGE
jgi:hypothetical protein